MEKGPFTKKKHPFYQQIGIKVMKETIEVLNSSHSQKECWNLDNLGITSEIHPSFEMLYESRKEITLTDHVKNEKVLPRVK